MTGGVKGKVSKIIVRPAMMYGLDTVSLTERQEVELQMLTFL